MSKLKCQTCGNVDVTSATMCTRCGTLYPASANPNDVANIHKGQVIANRYVVLDMIGKGGMGCIYKVQDNTLGEIVALKTLLPEYVKDKTVVERFFNEARIARALSHPHIVRVHDIASADGMVYISMELLQGRTLRSMLDKVTPGRRIPLNAILRMFDALCAALDYAHQYTIHRDIKPENVMVLPDGTVKLMDFGISKLMSNPNLTSASMVMGTPHYMSPEQLKNSANVDARADIYSVGVMLYEVLTGEVPSGVVQSPDTIQEVPGALDPVIAKCCQRDPAKRYQKIAELREQLRRIRLDVETQSGIKGDDIAVASSMSTGGRGLFPKLVSIAGLVTIGIGGYFALGTAEEHRQELLANAPVATEVVEVAGATPAPTVLAPENFAAMIVLVEEAKKRAEAELLEIESESHYNYAKRLKLEADTRWEVASDTGVMGAGWPSLHRYLAIAKWPEGMTFISEGMTKVYAGSSATDHQVTPFFIDHREVSGVEFSTFVQKHKWRQPKSLTATDLPVTNVTYYDAQAYNGARVPRAQLPTAAQWIRATESRIAVAGIEVDDEETSESIELPLTWSVFEWLRTEFDTSETEGMFGKAMPYADWSRDTDGSVIGRVAAMDYEEFSPSVGFRGVIELPLTLREARAWLE